MRSIGPARALDLVFTVPEYIEYVRRYAGAGDVWVGYRAPQDYTRQRWTRAYVDIDADTIQEATYCVNRLTHGIAEEYGVEPWVLFSGNKGYHVHLRHDPVHGSKHQYRSAWETLLRPWCRDLLDRVDLGPLMNPRSMPRLPYSVNTGSVANHGKLLFCVPCDPRSDVQWWLHGELRGEPSQVPRVPRVPGLDARLQDVMGEPREEFAAMREPSRGRIKALAEDAVAVAMRAAPHIRDGRKRYLRHLVVPGYLHLTGSPEDTMRYCRDYVEATGAAWRDYELYCRSQIQSADMGDTWLYPMRVAEFYRRYPELIASP